MSRVKGETRHMANDQLLTLLNLSRKEVTKVWPKYGFGLKSLPNERREMMKGEKNPKQILIDWVKEVQKAANIAYDNLDDCKYHSAQLAIYHILGQCETMMTVLKNSD